MGDFLGLKKHSRRVAAQARGRPGWFSNIIWHISSYFVTNITVTLAWIFFHVFNRTTVIGRKHIGDDPNMLLLSNHQSMIDSMPVGIEAFFPKSWIIAWWSTHTRCIPVKPGRRDLHALHKMMEVLPKGTIILFPEGTRSRSGNVGKGRPGAGLLALATRPRIIPVAIDGMQDLLPIGRSFPKIGQHIYIKYGEPIDYSDLASQPRTRETAQALVDKVMVEIRAQHEEIRRLRTEKRRKT
jgi:1-acyl-sn-glycerol-3-phosphate acyltransferase